MESGLIILIVFPMYNIFILLLVLSNKYFLPYFTIVALFSNVDYNIYSLNNPMCAMPNIQEFFNFFIFYLFVVSKAEFSLYSHF